jgi:hypothetical protein
MFSSHALRLLLAVCALLPWLLVYLMTKRDVSLRACEPWLRRIGIFLLACSIIVYVLDYTHLTNLLWMYSMGFWAASNWLRNRYKLVPSALTSLNISGRESANS